jgi:hypothetical protein
LRLESGVEAAGEIRREKLGESRIPPWVLVELTS